MFYNFLSSFLSGNKEVLRRVYKKAFAGIVLFLFSFDAFGHHTYGSPFVHFATGGVRSAANYLNAPAYGMTINGTFVHVPHLWRNPELFSMMMQGGLELDYMASHAERSLGYQDVDCVDRFLSVAMPLNIGICIGDVGSSIDPYVGIDARLNMIAKSRIDDYGCVDYFEDLNAKRFQLGLNVGVDLNLEFLYLGYRFTKDMTDFIPGMYSRNSCHRIVLGLNILWWWE